MIKECVDCGRQFTIIAGKKVRCKECQEEYRRFYKREFWQQNKDRYKERALTQLGGRPVTLKEIRNYKGTTLSDSAFIESNEAQFKDGARITFTQDEFNEFEEVDTMEELNKKKDKKSRKENYKGWKYEC